MLNRLWAPWRGKYIKGKHTGKCAFCKRDSKYVVERSNHGFSVLNIYPYNPGHVMVVPKRHVQDLNKLRRDELLDLFQMVERARWLLEKSLHPQGYNIGINLGKMAGAGIWRHLHIHVVPRWLGDTNCMPVIHNTKVMSISLDELCQLLVKTAKKYPHPLTSIRSRRISMARRASSR